MRFPEVLKQPSTFVAAALVTACLLALGAAVAGYAVIARVAQPSGAGQVTIVQTAQSGGAQTTAS